MKLQTGILARIYNRGWRRVRHNDRSFNSSPFRILSSLSFEVSDRLGFRLCKAAFHATRHHPPQLLLHSKRHFGRAKIRTFSLPNRLLFRNALKASKERFLVKSKEEILFQGKMLDNLAAPGKHIALKRQE